MKVGFVGLGKLGLPCALASEHYGKHEVYGVDPSAAVCSSIAARRISYKEAGAQELLDRTQIKVCELDELLANCELVFVAVQTPHDPRFEGVTRLTDERVDFDYSYLKQALAHIAESAARQRVERVVAVISTVLPGTIDREIRPLLNDWIRLCYNPFFIAMGTTIEDFTQPEFVLIGSEDAGAFAMLRSYYATIHSAPIYETDVRSAELVKVAYNTFIGMKIVFANTLMEICEGTGADVDAVTNSFALATKRLLSPKYLRAGMGDGGGCHPRDNIAMSFLARKLGISFDFFETLMVGREKQTQWLAELALQASRDRGMAITILGEAFKPESNLTVGSPSVLLANLLREAGAEVRMFDPYVNPEDVAVPGPSVYVIGTNHKSFETMPFAPGSIVIDPWGCIADQKEVTVRRLGRSSARPSESTTPRATRLQHSASNVAG